MVNFSCCGDYFETSNQWNCWLVALCLCSNVLTRWRDFMTKRRGARRNWVARTGRTDLCSLP